jgi:DNA-binding transcriptional LysR family regulator
VDAVHGLKLGRAEIGIIGTVAGWLLPNLTRRFRTMHPLVDLWVTEEPTVQLVDQVAARSLSQALVNLPYQRADQLNSELLFTEDLVLILPPDHPSRGRAKAPLAAFRDSEWLLPEPGNALRGLICDALAGVGFMPKPRIQVGKKQLMEDLAVAGLGVALIPGATALNRLPVDSGRIVRVTEPQISRSVGLITHRTGTRSPGDLALATVLRESIDDHARAEATMGTIKVADGREDGSSASRSVNGPDSRLP